MNKSQTQRLTSAWTPTLKEAFGDRGERGRLGEIFLHKYLVATGHEVIDHENDYKNQVKGIDFSFKKPQWQRYYTGDCKANLRPDGSFIVEFFKYSGGRRRQGWYFTCRADRIFHVNVKEQWICYYDLGQLKERLSTYSIATPTNGLLSISSKDSRFKDLIRSIHYYDNK